ncbi:MAG: 30S ribosomal protein S2 [Candidatus Pacebacteria bacterium]|nr:30S ribosomal protein S2 [Candidatus Paceibacterota bacterium]
MEKAKKNEVSLMQLLEVGAHFGHQPRRWNPKMAPYLYGKRSGVHIFDLVKTKKKLEEACDFVKNFVAGGGEIVFVGTKRQAAEIIREEAKRAGVAFVAQRWLGGTITNWSQIKKSIKKFGEMKAKKAAGEYEKYTKKENLLIAREIRRLEKFFGGLTGLKEIPEAMFMVDVKREEAALKEAAKKKIPVVAMVDSNSDPNLVDYPIPINDDAIRSIKLVVTRIADAVIEGRQIKEKKLPENSKSDGKNLSKKKPEPKEKK